VIVNSKFRPRWWLRNPHLQTIIASKVIVPPIVHTEAERLELDDGDFLDIHWSISDDGPTDRPIVCLFHGLAGCIDSAYARGAISQLQQYGYRCVFMHWRGCSGEPNRLAKSYHSGATEDIHRIIELVADRYPDAPIVAAGFSLGGNALLKYLGEQGTCCKLGAAVAVCPPLVLSAGADKMNQGLARGYQRYLLGLMRTQVNAKRQRYPDLVLPEAGKDLNSFWRFDDALTARDDPFFTPAVIPDNSELSSSVTLELSDHGGHVGFIGSSVEKRSHRSAIRWLDTWVARELAALLASKDVL